jgi:hypothetical protein
MTAHTIRSLFRPIPLFAVVALAFLAFGTCSMAQRRTMLPTLLRTDCPNSITEPEEVLHIKNDDLSFSINCGLKPKRDKKRQEERFRAIVAWFNLGLFADNLLKHHPVEFGDLLEIRSKIDTLCSDIHCKNFRESKGIDDGMSDEKLLKFIVDTVTDDSARGGAECNNIDVRFSKDVRAMTHATAFLVRRFPH